MEQDCLQGRIRDTLQYHVRNAYDVAFSPHSPHKLAVASDIGKVFVGLQVFRHSHTLY